MEYVLFSIYLFLALQFSVTMHVLIVTASYKLFKKQQHHTRS
jgi:hypothetical protein